jgi:hypothetical protein
MDRKIGVETVAAAFTDHLAVVLRLRVDIPILRKGRRLWKMNTPFIEENRCKENLRQQWDLWKRRKLLFTEATMWLGRYIKNSDRYLSKKSRSAAGTSGELKTSIRNAYTTSFVSVFSTETN